MKNFDSRVYSINDFLEWDNNKQLVLNPKFQRRSVWTAKARSYLMDTIIRGKPIPKVFLMQKLNAQTKQSVREVVDGQQRLRTIISYCRDGFVISKSDNPRFGGLFFSQLSQVDGDVQAFILNYEISADLLVNMPDSEVLDIFSRLNSYSVILNEQEKLYANHFGVFKVLAEKIGHSFNDYWRDNKILTDQEILRMGDVTLTSDLLIAMIDGINSKKSIKKYYDEFENQFDHSADNLHNNFNATIDTIQHIFPNGLRSTEFVRTHLFYTLFTAIYHLKFGVPGIDRGRMNIADNDYSRIENRLEIINFIIGTSDLKQLNDGQLQFLNDSRRATTDKPVRQRRTEYIIDLILQPDAVN